MFGFALLALEGVWNGHAYCCNYVFEIMSCVHKFFYHLFEKSSFYAFRYLVDTSSSFLIPSQFIRLHSLFFGISWYLFDTSSVYQENVLNSLFGWYLVDLLRLFAINTSPQYLSIHQDLKLNISSIYRDHKFYIYSRVNLIHSKLSPRIFFDLSQFLPTLFIKVKLPTLISALSLLNPLGMWF